MSSYQRDFTLDEMNSRVFLKSGVLNLLALVFLYSFANTSGMWWGPRGAAGQLLQPWTAVAAGGCRAGYINTGRKGKCVWGLEHCGIVTKQALWQRTTYLFLTWSVLFLLFLRTPRC